MREYLDASGNSSFGRLFDFYSGAVWGTKHAPLVLGWTNEQLAPSVEILQPYLPDHYATGLKFAVASCARSLVLENKLTGQPMRYARGKEHYRIPARYRSEDRFYTWFYVTRAMDALHGVGLVEQDMGVWLPCRAGRQSVAWPTEKLLILLDS